MNDHSGARFQRSQSQNDLDRPTYDNRFYSPADLRSSASGYDIQPRDSDQVLRRHPSDVGDRYRRSYEEWNGTRMPLSALDNTDVSRSSALESRQADQKYQPPSDASRNWESSRGGEPRDTGYRHDNDGRRVYSEGDEFRPGRENVANVTAVNKKPVMRDGNPKNQDIINWLQHGDDLDSRPHDSGYSPDRTDLDRTVSDHSRLANDRMGDERSNQAGYRAEPSRAELSASRSYPATRSDDEFVPNSQAGELNSLTPGPKDNKENTVFPHFRVSNPMYDAGHYGKVGEQTRRSDGSGKHGDVISQQQGYNWSDARGSFADNSRWPNTEHSQQGSHGQVRGMGHELASSGSQRDGSSQIPPPKPTHTAAYRFDQSEDLPPSLPPKLANQQAPLKPPHVVAGQLDQYQRSAEAPITSQLRVMKDDSGNQMDLTPEYAIVRKRTAQSLVPVDDLSWRPELERSRADGARYQPDVASRLRQSPDGTLDSPEPSSNKTNSAIQSLAIGVTSSGDFSKEHRPAAKSASQEDLTSTPSLRSPLPSDNTPENFSGHRRSEPQGGVENIDPQVTMPYWQVIHNFKCTHCCLQFCYFLALYYLIGE